MNLTITHRISDTESDDRQYHTFNAKATSKRRSILFGRETAILKSNSPPGRKHQGIQKLWDASSNRGYHMASFTSKQMPLVSQSQPHQTTKSSLEHSSRVFTGELTFAVNWPPC